MRSALTIFKFALETRRAGARHELVIKAIGTLNCRTKMGHWLTAIGRSGFPRNREKHGSKVQKSLTTTPRAQVCGGQTSPHRLRLVVSNSTCPQLSSSGGGTAVINNDAQIINSLDERGFIEQWKQEYPDLATAQEPPWAIRSAECQATAADGELAKALVQLGETVTKKLCGSPCTHDWELLASEDVSSHFWCTRKHLCVHQNWKFKHATRILDVIMLQYPVKVRPMPGMWILKRDNMNYDPTWGDWWE